MTGPLGGLRFGGPYPPTNQRNHFGRAQHDIRIAPTARLDRKTRRPHQPTTSPRHRHRLPEKDPAGTAPGNHARRRPLQRRHQHRALPRRRNRQNSQQLHHHRRPKLPDGTSADTAIKRAGETWKSWGWYVTERDGFYKPNQFGYGPDGYRLQIMAAAKPGYPPSLESISPCFPADLPDNRSPFPPILSAG